MRSQNSILLGQGPGRARCSGRHSPRDAHLAGAARSAATGALSGSGQRRGSTPGPAQVKGKKTRYVRGSEKPESGTEGSDRVGYLGARPLAPTSWALHAGPHLPPYSVCGCSAPEDKGEPGATTENFLRKETRQVLNARASPTNPTRIG